MILNRTYVYCSRRAASRAECTAGNSRPIRVKPVRFQDMRDLRYDGTSRESVSTPQGAGIKPTGHTFAPTRRVGLSTFPLATDPVSTTRKTRPYPGWESLRTRSLPAGHQPLHPRDRRGQSGSSARHAAYPRLSRSYEEDPSGTTAGIAAISSKFNEEYQAAQPTWSRIQSPGISVSDERHGNRK